NDIEARLLPSGAFTARVAPRERLVVRASGPGGADERELRVAIDNDPPDLKLDLPARSVTAEDVATLSGEVHDAHPAKSVLVDGVAFAVGADGRFQTTKRRLVPGDNPFDVVALDAAGNRSEARVVVVQDRDPPRLELEGGAADIVT